MRRPRALVWIAAAGLAAAALGATPARAQEVPFEAPPADRWTFNVTPYLWATSLDGNAAVAGVKSDVDVPFRDIAKDLSLAAMVMAGVRRGPWGFGVNVLYARVSPDEKTDALKIDVTTDLAQLAFGPFYRAVEWTYRESATGRPLRLVVEPYLGGRLNHLRLETKFKPRNNLGDLIVRRIGRHHDASETWVDPIAGTRVGIELAERWVLAGAGDVGGVVAGSDFAWNVQGYLGYRASLFGHPTTYAFGYRALHVDYDHKDFGWDVTQHGPILGAVFRF